MTLDGCVECLNCFPPHLWIQEKIDAKQLSERNRKEREEVYGDLSEEADFDSRAKRIIRV